VFVTFLFAAVLAAASRDFAACSFWFVTGIAGFIRRDHALVFNRYDKPGRGIL
jgi:hypothetical protein